MERTFKNFGFLLLLQCDSAREYVVTGIDLTCDLKKFQFVACECLGLSRLAAVT